MCRENLCLSDRLLDGFVNDRNGGVARLYPDLDALRKTEVLQEAIKTTGVVVMGRHAYEMATGDFTGYEFQVPIFVLTHHAPGKVAEGENDRLTFTFVTEGIQSAIDKAKAAAGDRSVTVIGGAKTAQQGIRAGLFDEIQIDIAPVLLGEGLRLFEHLGTEPIELEQIQLTQSPGVTHLRFRVVKDESDLPTGLATPAQRALAGAGIQRLEQLARLNESEVKLLHGIGPKALEQLRRALKNKGLSFAAH